jgi:hypothetical protein
MARSKTDTVEYFPHIAKPGKTLYILEGQFGNDGYAFWFKLLEILSSSKGHFYDASTEVGWNYLAAYTRVSPQSATEILLLLSNLENIDLDLWKNHRILWCQALLDNLKEVYRKRKRELPKKPICDDNADYCASNAEKGGFKPISATSRRQPATEMPQSKVEESKEEKRRKRLIAPPGPADTAGAFFFSCPYFDVDFDYRMKLAKEFPALTDGLLKGEFSKMEDWIIDNKGKKHYKANGHLLNPRAFIKNWLKKVVVSGQQLFGEGNTPKGYQGLRDYAQGRIKDVE